MKVNNENMFYLRDTVFKFIQEKEPELDRVTVLWCVENLCLLGKRWMKLWNCCGLSNPMLKEAELVRIWGISPITTKMQDDVRRLTVL